MNYTRESLPDLAEDVLRREVLVPLFSAMGFSDVREHHGGPLEQGKDIVMWKFGEVGLRENYAVVVKAGSINGRSTGPASAGNVSTQVRQCFGQGYLAAGSLVDERIHRCWVVASGGIPKQALQALRSTLTDGNYSILMTLIDGPKLWELIQKYLPTATLWDRTRAVQRVLGSSAPGVSATVQITKDQAQVHLAPAPGIDIAAEQWQAKMVLQFPDTPDGKQALSAFQKHLTAGAPVSIDGAFVKSFSAPAALQAFIGNDIAIGELSLGPRRAPHSVQITLAVQPPDGPVATLEYLQCDAQVGSEQITLRTRDDASAFRLEVVINLHESRISIAIKGGAGRGNVSQVLRLLRFTSAISLGGVLTITDSPTGLFLVSAHVAAGTLPAPPEDWVDFVSKVEYLQRALRVPLTIPNRDIRGDEVLELQDLVTAIQTGSSSRKMPAAVVTMSLNRAGAKALLEAIDGSGLNALRREVEDMESSVLDVPLHLGPGAVICTALGMLAEDRATLLSALEKAEEGEFVPVRVVGTDSTVVQHLYDEWPKVGGVEHRTK